MKHKGWRKDPVESISSSLSKTERRKMDSKVNKINIHLHALFSAVEHSQVEKARTILNTTDVDVNCPNNDGLVVLDIAVLTNNLPVVKLLQSAGAIENPQFASRGADACAEVLDRLLSEVSGRLDSTKGSTPLMTSSNNNGAVQRECQLWNKRRSLLNAMKQGLHRLRPPYAPSSVTLEVVASDSVSLRISEPHDQNLAVCTKLKIQWSLHFNFSSIYGEREVLQVNSRRVRIQGLPSGKRFFFRVFGGNIRGYGPPAPSLPPSCIPSAWCDGDNRSRRLPGRLQAFQELFEQFRLGRSQYSCSELNPSTQDDVEEIPVAGNGGPALGGGGGSRRGAKKSTIKQLFTAAPKFVKERSMRRGLFLATVVYAEDDRIVVTNEEHLPIVEIDETYPSNSSAVMADFHWLSKVACTWEDVKSLRQDIERSSGTSTELKGKILNAVVQLQSSLGTPDLGQVHYRPLKDSSGTMVFCLVQEMKNPKLLQSLSVKWLPISKLHRKSSGLREESSEGEPMVGDILIQSLEEQIAFHKRAQVPLTPGLYLGYIKMQSSVESLTIAVSEKFPSVPPFVKIRDNAHVSREEWEWIRHLSEKAASDHPSPHHGSGTNSLQTLFERQISIACRKLLLQHLKLAEDTLPHHRLLCREVVEVSSDVSFLLVLPPSNKVCSGIGDYLEHADLPVTFLPVQMFELRHLRVFQADLISCYARLSSVLEVDLTMAQQALRAAFSTEEVALARDRLARLQDLQGQMESTWKVVRWMVDTLGFTREKSQQQIPSEDSVAKNLNLLTSASGFAGPEGVLPLRFLQEPDIPSNCLGPSPRKSPINSPRPKKSSTRPPPPIPPHTSNHLSPALLQPSASASALLNAVGPHSLPALDTTGTPPRTLPAPEGEMENDPSCYQTSPHMYPHRNHLVPKPSPVASPLRKASAPEISSPSLKEPEKVFDLSSSCEDLFGGPTQPPSSSDGGAKSSSGSLASSTDSGEQRSKPEHSPYLRIEGDNNSILEVFAAYHTGLASGTSVKLHVTPRTTAREVVDLVVQQLNMAVALKGSGGPFYSSEELPEFCLVAVIGARERCLREDFRPLELQSQWRKGKLFVRRKGDLLAAVPTSTSGSSPSPSPSVPSRTSPRRNPREPPLAQPELPTSAPSSAYL